MSDLQWNGDAALDHVKGNAAGWLTHAALTVNRRAKELLSIAGTGKSGGKRVYGSNPSKPGEPPRKQTGNLRRSVTYEVDRETLQARVGTNVKYGLYLELGTKRGLSPRPWLRRALAEMQSRVNELLNQGGADNG